MLKHTIGDEDLKTGRPCKDAQMHALKLAHGEPKRQRDRQPDIGPGDHYEPRLDDGKWPTQAPTEVESSQRTSVPTVKFEK